LKVVSRLPQAQGCHIEYALPKNFDFLTAVKTNQEIEMTAMYSRSPPWHLPRLWWRSVTRRAKNPFLKGSFAGAGSNLYEYSRALGRRDAFITKAEHFLSGYDAWICPSASIQAPHHAELKNFMEVMMADIDVNGKRIPYDLATFGYTSIFNLTGSPVVAIPASFTSDCLPIGVQITGKRWRDARLLDVAETISDVFGPFKPPPYHFPE
jgi:amidase